MRTKKSCNRGALTLAILLAVVLCGVDGYVIGRYVGASGEKPAAREVQAEEEPEKPFEEPQAEETEEEEDAEDEGYTVTDIALTRYVQTNSNMRSGPSIDYEVIGGYRTGSMVQITGQADTGWYRIDYRGGEGFISNKLVGEEAPAPEPEAAPEPQPAPAVESAAEAAPEPEPAPVPPKTRDQMNESELNALCLSEAGVHGGMDPWAISTEINNYLCAIAAYDKSYSHYDSDDVLKYGTGVCQAYAAAYRRLMNAASVPTDYVYGYGYGNRGWGRHGWNRFAVDGVYYYVDVTWNDCLGQNLYLNISYEEMSRDHQENGYNRADVH